MYIYIEFSTVVLKFQTDLAKAPYANDEPLTCLERAWRAPRPPSRCSEAAPRKGLHGREAPRSAKESHGRPGKNRKH